MRWRMMHAGHGRSRLRAAAALLLLVPLIDACHPRPETTFDAQQPRTAAVRNIGGFSEALRCMDNLFLTLGKRDIYITTAGIPDATGLIAAGTKEMFITAVSRMSARSNAFRFVDYDITQLDVQVLSELVGLRQDFVAPNYYIRGAITQLDSSVLSSSASAGISLPAVDLGLSSDQVVSVVSMDLNVARLTTRQIIPGVSASNSIAVVRSGRGGDVGGVVGRAGLSFSVSLDRSEGFAQAVRNLVELSTIEVLGKLAQVPYWECLAIESTNPSFRAEARNWFDAMGTEERNRFIEAGLTRSGHLQGGSRDLAGAIARYQGENDLVPSGRADFELYYRLLASDPSRGRAGRTAAAAPAAVPVAASVPAVPAAASLPATPPAAAPRAVLTTDRGARPRYRVGDSMVLRIQPTQDAYVYCYYRDGDNAVSRIYPNRFQPNALVASGTVVAVPPGTGAFSIRFEHPGATEEVSCLAADREVGLLLPQELMRQDLEPLPVGGLDDIAARFRAIPGARVDDARLPIAVTR